MRINLRKLIKNLTISLRITIN